MERKRILVTRAAHQASALGELLRAAGFEPVLIPAIELADPSSFAALDAALARIEEFDWLLFTSANAVDVVQRRLGDGMERISGVQTAAIGRGTERAMMAAGMRVDLVAPEAVGEGLAAALEMSARGRRMLLVRAEVARDVLPERLRAAGAEVTVVAAYRTVIPAGSVELVRALFAGGGPDGITFTSSSSVTNLLALLAASGLELPREVLRVSIGPVTSETLREAGYPADAEAAEATLEALVRAVASKVKVAPLP